MIVGRERERRLLDALVSAADERGGTMIIRGEPGMGKTTLLDYVNSTAAARMLRVLRVRGAESETALPFAALADLLLPLREHLDDLPKVQRTALEVSLALSDGSATSPYAVCAGTLNMLAAAGDVRPLVVLVDDLQWIDLASRQVLLFVGRRLASERAVMVMTVRSEEADETERSGLPSVGLAGLDPAVCAELVRGHGLEMTSPVLDRLVRWTDGNPLAVLEIATGLRPAQRRGTEPLEATPSLGRHLERVWSARLDLLPKRTGQALLLVAASQSSSVAVVAAALAADGTSLADLEPACKDGLVTATEAAVEFRHALLRAIVLRRAGSGAVLRAYRLLADVSAGELRTWYLAAASPGPDEQIAAALDGVAAEARRRGAFGSAARAGRRAAELTAVGDGRAGRLRDAAIDALLASLPHDASAWSDEAAGIATDPGLRADVELVRCRASTWFGRPARAHDELVRTAAAICNSDPARAAALLAEAALASTAAGNYGSARQLAERCHDVAASSGVPLSFLMSACLAYAKALDGRHADARAQLVSGPSAPTAADLVGDQLPYAVIARTRGLLEEDEEALRTFTTLIATARRSGKPNTFAHALIGQAQIEFRIGRWAEAYADATEGLSWAEETQQSLTVASGRQFLARIDAARGDRAQCEEQVALVRERFGHLSLSWIEINNWLVLGLAALGAGEHDAAVAHLERAWAMGASEAGNVVGELPFAADYAEALIRAGDRARAELVLDRLAECARGSGLAWPEGVAARCRGILASEPDEAAAEAEFARAAAAHARCRPGMPFEQARTLLCLGEVRRRHRRPAAARVPLRAAHAIFESLGARPWAGRAAAELAAAGVRPERPSRRPGLGQLTPQEVQIARAVATGMNNIEVAAALFVSRKTVEAHLTRIYRKLGLRSRSELTLAYVAHGGSAR